MISCCPACGSDLIVVQNVDRLVNPVLMPKLEEPIQLRCRACGWMGYISALITA